VPTQPSPEEQALANFHKFQHSFDVFSNGFQQHFSDAFSGLKVYLLAHSQEIHHADRKHIQHLQWELDRSRECLRRMNEKQGDSEGSQGYIRELWRKVADERRQKTALFAANGKLSGDFAVIKRENERLVERVRGLMEESRAAKEAKAVKKENEAMETEIEAMREENQMLKEENKVMKEENKAIKEENEVVMEKNKALVARVLVTNERVKELKKQVERPTEELEGLKQPGSVVKTENESGLVMHSKPEGSGSKSSRSKSSSSGSDSSDSESSHSESNKSATSEKRARYRGILEFARQKRA
jgi:hypothetical protein